MQHCSNRCCDVNSDQDNCGRCGNRCSGGQQCQGGRCGCERGMQLCDGTCKQSCQPQGCSSGYVSCNGRCTRSTTVSTAGAACPCGVTCDASKGLSCHDGNCRTTCGTGQQTCSGSCVSLSDLHNCDTCGHDVCYTLPYSLIVSFTDLCDAQCDVECQGFPNIICGPTPFASGPAFVCTCSQFPIVTL